MNIIKEKQNNNKILHIKECYFKLTDNFEGTLGEALLLMSNRLVQSEAYKEVHKPICTDLYDYLINSDSKAIIAYEFIQ